MAAAGFVVQNIRMFAGEDRLLHGLEDFNVGHGAGDGPMNNAKARKRNKKRKNKKESQNLLLRKYNGGDSEELPLGEERASCSQLAQESSNCMESCSINEVKNPAVQMGGLESRNLKQMSELSLENCGKQVPTTYAAVCGRNSRTTIRSNVVSAMSVNVEPSFVNPLLRRSSSMDSVRPITAVQNDGGYGETQKDVGIQVPDVSLNNEHLKGVKQLSRGTMTVKKPWLRNKGVSVKLCCNLEEKVTPPVEFFGQCFTFENALASTVSQLGIRFLELEDGLDISVGN